MANKAKLETVAETPENPEFEAGFRAFMRRCAGYAAAHAGGSWNAFWAAAKDDKPETADYLEGFARARDRMTRECGGLGFGDLTPRALTAFRKAEGGKYDANFHKTEKRDV